jgi:dCTP deaminase
VGDEVYLSEQHVPNRLSESNQYLVLPPGQFALIKTYERVNVPRDLVAFITIRSKFKLQGLVNVSGFHVDPTYNGYLIFAVQNVGPNDIRLLYKDCACMIMWARLDEPFDGAARPPGYTGVTLDQMSQLGGSSITLAALQKQIQSLTVSMRFLGAISTAAIVALVVLLIVRLTK